MAPTAQAPVKRANYDGSRPRFPSLEAWLSVYGNTEYAIYKRDAAPNPMTYEEWSKSEHVLGPFLWYTTLDVWEEDSSSEEDFEVAPPNSSARAPTKKQSKKPSVPNGHGKRDPAKSTAAVAQPTSEDAAAAAKRKRKPKKPYLSEDIVVSDFSDEVDVPHPIIEAVPSVVNVPASATANGRRKSGGRKKKHYLSAETISPEDEDDYPLALNGAAAAAASLHKPSAPAGLHSPVVATTPEESGGKRGKKSKKKSLSHTIISRDDDEQLGSITDAVTTPKNDAASPERPGSSSRRGLRTRTPAQQRPYFHNAQAFDDLVSDEPETEGDMKPSPPKPKQKLKFTNLAQVSYPEDTGENMTEDQERMFFINGEDDDDEVTAEVGEPKPSKRAHYKGKGRAWKKTSDDEDEDYKSPAKEKSVQPKRKFGRRKSSQIAEVAPGVEELRKPDQQDDQKRKEYIDSIQSSPTQNTNKKQRKPRKIHHLSEEFVLDEDPEMAPEPRTTESQDERVDENTITSTTPTQKTPKKRGRPRRSDQDSTYKTPSLKDASTLLSYDDATPARQESPLKKTTPTTSAEKNSLPDVESDRKDIEVGVMMEHGLVDVTQPEEREDSKSVTPSTATN